MPRFEFLESRQLLALVTWDGGAGTFNYFDINNWDTNALPASDDVVVIPDLVGTPTINIGSSTSVQSITSAETVALSNATLTLSETSSISGALTLTNSTLTGSGTVSVSGLTSTTNSNIVGPGVLNADGGMLFHTSLSDIVDRTINVSGTSMETTNVRFWDGDGAVVNLQPSAVWNMQDDVGLTIGTGVNTFNNAGTFRKSSGLAPPALVWFSITPG